MDVESTNFLLNDYEDLPAEQVRAILEQEFPRTSILSATPPACTRAPLEGLPTGFHDLDALTGGLFAGELTVVVGLPSSGKSTFVQNIARKALLRQDKKTVVFVSLETTKQQIIRRIVFAQARVEAGMMSAAGTPTEAIARVKEAHERLYRGRMMICDRGDVHVSAIPALCREIEYKEPGLILVDGAERIASLRSGNAALGEILEALKHSAQAAGVPLIATVGIPPPCHESRNSDNLSGLTRINQIQVGTSTIVERSIRPLRLPDIPVAVPLLADTVAILHRPDWSRYASDMTGDAMAGQKGLEVIELHIERQPRSHMQGRVQIAFLTRWARMGGVLWENAHESSP